MRHARKSSPFFRQTLLASLISGALSVSAHSSIMRDDVDLQLFRDFAENKGKFTVGATNVAIEDKQGNALTPMLQGVPMPDLAVADHYAIATLFAPQYIASVAHNGSYQNISFGFDGSKDTHQDYDHFGYSLVDRNNWDNNSAAQETNLSAAPAGDYHTPRLNKLVTEVAPAIMPTDLVNNTGIYTNRYTHYLRVGSGTQILLDATTEQPNNKSHLERRYQISGGNIYRTGGTPMQFWYALNNTLGFGSSLLKDPAGALATYPQAGDSGSPLFGYDPTTQQWHFIAVLRSGYAHKESQYVINRPGLAANIQQQDVAGTITTGGALRWRADGNHSTLGSLNVDLNDVNLGGTAALNHGKSVYFEGEDGSIVLENSINQGAGALYFGANYTVSAQDDSVEWKGAGISVAEGKTVEWKVKNPANDRLAKIGAGTLYVKAQSVNSGQLQVGDGTVILEQAEGLPDNASFSRLLITSGRPTVKLQSAKVINADEIYFGFRGGRLDLNGNDLSFSRIKNLDDGAMIVNHNLDQTATVKITGTTTHQRIGYNGYIGETDANRPNGGLNLIFQPTNAKTESLLMTGGLNLNGTMTVAGGSVTLSGRPTPHAYDYRANKEVVDDNDWQTRSFNASRFDVAEGATLHFGRNVASVNGDFAVSGTLNLGYANGITPVCRRSDRTGIVNRCETTELNEALLATIPTTQVASNLTLGENSQFNLGKTHLLGAIEADAKSSAFFTASSRWTMSDSSSLGSLALVDGAEIHLDGNDEAYQRLTVQGDLSGQGRFYYRTDLASGQSDQLVVNGSASGSHQLFVQNTGEAPATESLLTLVRLNPEQANTASFELGNTDSVVDLGAWRYRLHNDAGRFYLARQPVETQKGEAVSLADLPIFDEALTEKGESVSIEEKPTFDGELTLKGESVSIEEKPIFDGELTLKGESVSIEEKPIFDGELTLTGESVSIEDKPTFDGELTLKGESVAIEEKPIFDGELTLTGESVAIEDKPIFDGELTLTGESVAIEDKPIFDGELTLKGESASIEEKPLFEAALDLPVSEIQPVRQADVTSRYANAAIADLSAQWQGLTMLHRSLDQRLRQAVREEGWTAWATQERRRNKVASDEFRAYRQQSQLSQIGIEKAQGGWRGGVLFSTAKSDLRYESQASGKQRLNAVSLFGQYQGQQGSFVAVTSQYGKAESRIHTGEQTNFSRQFVGVSGEIGQRLSLGAFFIQPSLGLRYDRINSANYRLDGANVASKAVNFRTFFAGATLGAAFKLGELTLRPSWSSFYADSQSDAQPIQVNEAKLQLGAGNRQQHEAAVEVQAGMWSLAGQVGWQKTADSRQRYASLKLAYRW